MKLRPLTCLLGLVLPLPALALGLGELAVRSNLGQPLHVTVELLDPAPELETACFRLRPADNGLDMPPETRLAVERGATRTLLHITTPRAFNEPVAQFVLAAGCEASLQREYVLLLDPPAPLEAVSTVPNAAAAGAATAPVATTRRAHSRANARAASDAPAAEARREERARPGRSATPKPVTRADAPRLVISGRRLPADATGAPAATQDAARPAPDTLTSTELSDENTALLRRIAHMEAQLMALQARNAELEAKLGAGPKAAAPAVPAAAAPAPEWPIYSLGLIGLLAGSGALVSWMRRRPAPQRTLMEQMLWTSLKPIRPVIARPRVGPLPPLDTAMPRNDSIMATRPAPASRAQDPEDFPLTAASDGTEVREDVIDQAEVLVVHGHTRLAIQLLREHLRTAPAESPVPWLLLLDLLHREQDQAGYDQARAECRRHFNVRLPEQPPAMPADPGDGLLAYPHIVDALTRAWNTPGLDALLQDLIYDRRGGVRVGFEPGAYQDILLLRAIARQSALPVAA